MFNVHFFRKASLAIASVSLFAACSGGGGGGGGSTTASSPLQVPGAKCKGTDCFADNLLSALNNEDVSIKSGSAALAMYATFNDSLIPMVNATITKIERGAALAGAVSCDDITVPSPSQVITLDGVSYTVKGDTSALAAPSSSGFTVATTNKGLYGKLGASTPIVQADVNCGASTDASPLIGRVKSVDGTNSFNAWYEKGTSKHIVIMAIAKYNGTQYGVWFKTTDGDEFSILLSSGSTVYRAHGKKSIDTLSFDDNGSISCTINGASSASACSGYDFSAFPTQIVGTLLTGGTAKNWSALSASDISPVDSW